MAFRCGTGWGLGRADGVTFYPNMLWKSVGGVWLLLTGADAPGINAYAAEIPTGGFAETTIGSGYEPQPALNPSAAYAHYGIWMRPGAFGGAGGKLRHAVFYEQTGGAAPNAIWGLGSEWVSSSTSNLGLIHGVSPNVFVGAKKLMGYTTWYWVNVIIRLSDMNAQLYVDDVLITSTGDNWEDPPSTTWCDGKISLYAAEFGSKSGHVWRVSSIILNDDLGSSMNARLGTTYRGVACCFPTCSVTGYEDFNHEETPYTHADNKAYGNVDSDYDGDADWGYNGLNQNVNGAELYQMAQIPSGTVEAVQLFVPCNLVTIGGFDYGVDYSTDRFIVYLEDPGGSPVENVPMVGGGPAISVSIATAARAQAPGAQAWTTALFNKLGAGVQRYNYAGYPNKKWRFWKMYAEVFGPSLGQPANNGVITACLADAPPTVPHFAPIYPVAHVRKPEVVPYHHH